MRRLITSFLAGTDSLRVVFLRFLRRAAQTEITIGSKFFTEQVVLAELLAQHIEARTGIMVERKTNLGGTLLVHKALLAGDLDLYVEYTGTALTAVLGEKPSGDEAAIFQRVKEEYRGDSISKSCPLWVLRTRLPWSFAEKTRGAII